MIDALGHPLDGMKDDGWVEINLDDFVKYVIRSGKRTEKEDEALQELCLPGLVMPRLLQARELPPEARKDEQRVENMPLINATLEALQKAEAPPLIHGPDAFNNDFNPFSPAAADSTGKTTKPMGGMPAGKQPKGGKLKTTPNGMPPKPGEPAGEDIPPEYVLVRASMSRSSRAPSTSTGFRSAWPIPISMRTDVSNPDWAKGEELKSDWLVIDDPVVVPPEMYYYAVDQKEVDNKVRPRSYMGLNALQILHKERQVAFQIHRWVENASIIPGQNFRPASGPWPRHPGQPRRTDWQGGTRRDPALEGYSGVVCHSLRYRPRSGRKLMAGRFPSPMHPRVAAGRFRRAGVHRRPSMAPSR